MTDDKTKVRDLATELGVPTKNLLQALRELDIPAKSTSTGIAAEDVERVKNHLKETASSGQGENRREVQPGVIVRRRRQTAEEPAATGDVAPAPTPSAEAPASPSAAEPETRPAAPEQSSVQAAEPAQAAPEQPEAVPAAPEKEAKPEEPRQRQPRENKPRKRSGLRETAPAAKVISRPQDIAAAKAAEEAAAKAAAEAAAAAAKAAEEAAAKAEAEAAAKKKAENDDKPRKQPAASARPEGSSAPSLLPPVSENRAAASEGEEGEEDRRERRKPRRPQEPSAPQVRVISRPDPVAVAAARTQQAAGENRGRDGRDDNRPRPGYQGQRPGGAPGGQRPAGGYQGQRPSGGAAPSSFGPAAAPGAPLPDRDGQSKKKRNKTARRTVDFQDTMGGRRRDDDGDDMPRSRGARRRPKNVSRPAPQTTQPLKAAKRKIRVEEAIRVADMAHQMGLKSNEIIKVLFNLGIMATINKALDIDTASVVAAEFGYEVEKVGFAEEEYLAEHRIEDKPEELQRRPPVVTIMGHVDHGKTSLLDAIRKTNVTSGEAGGITQHIGAYHVKTKRGEIVFLDTPGHEAFTAMRARGAQVTDLVVLVVAADDGVMEQTREAVSHSRAAGVPIMVAVNKMDKPTANPDRVLQELASLGLVPEEWGGDTVVCKVSAKTREGLDEMLEMLALQADILELKANPDKLARGHIVEAKLDKGRGPVATVLIQEGTLHQGDTFVCGVFSGRVRAMFNDQGRKVKEAGPSIPVEVQGFEGVPEAGEEFICLEDEKLARRIAESRAVKLRERELAKQSRVTLETFLSRKADDQEALVLNLVVKSDVQGSLEAIVDALNKQSTEKVRINIIHGGTGAITESDILLASASDAIIIGFNVRPTAKVKEMAEHESVDIRFYDIIYKLVDEIKSAMAGLLAPVSREVYLGQAEIREVFSVPKVGTIAGSHVVDGKITRNANVRLLRNGVVVHNGKVASLRRFKDDVREVLKGYECGISLENFNDIKVGDVIEAFEMVEEAATL
ncbi:MAG TPA: translation initiation factor IF-2 [Candidatus Bilophila faecipullorum]|uniref:Translation initiation factor IF-2 n=8 Tax=Bilophila TaxID=35832 RepID=A0A9D1U9Y1_9BACT|nr:translation initiation factor IF-2 [Candidatus Bilophila faecipullorum]